jgi:hypothetical protein
MHLLSLLFLLLIFQQGKVEEYYIVQTKGDIIIKKTGQVLRKGDKIKAEEVIEFRPADARAIVISSQKGTLILQRPQHAAKKDSELVYMVKSSLLTSSGVLGTRNGPISSMTELKNYLTKGNFLVLDTAKIAINTQAIPLSKDQYFFIRYNYLKQNINKKLEHAGSHVLIDWNLLSVDGQKVPADSCQNFTMYYRNEKKNESVPVTRFSPLFPDIDKINSEAKLIIDVLRKANKNKEQITTEVKTFINEAYGKPTEDDFASWISRLL